MTRHAYLCLAVSACLATASYIVGASSWPALALALLAPLAIAFFDPVAYRALLREFDALGAFIRRELTIERVRERAWLNPA